MTATFWATKRAEVKKVFPKFQLMSFTFFQNGFLLASSFKQWYPISTRKEISNDIPAPTANSFTSALNWDSLLGSSIDSPFHEVLLSLYPLPGPTASTLFKSVTLYWTIVLPVPGFKTTKFPLLWTSIILKKWYPSPKGTLSQ